MSEIKFEKGPVEFDEIAAYISDLSDTRFDAPFPMLRFKGRTLFITDVLNHFNGKRRLVTMTISGKKKLFDVSEPLFFDGEKFNFQNEYVEMTWKEYKKYWADQRGSRPDVIHWCEEPWIVYSFTKIIGDDSLYVVIGRKSSERVTLQFDKDTIITRAVNEVGTGATWTVTGANIVANGKKWD